MLGYYISGLIRSIMVLLSDVVGAIVFFGILIYLLFIVVPVLFGG